MSYFIKKIIIFILTLVISISLIDLIIDDPISDPLLEYQLNKIDKNEIIKSVFIGDSSCGNSIDVSYFGTPVQNLSLTGDYNISNTYRMLKRAHISHPELESVFIMQSFDVFSRNDSDMLNIDLNSLNYVTKVYSKLKGLKYMFTVRPFVSFKIDYDNDFLKQNDKRILKSENLVLEKDISTYNVKSILKIKNYCIKNNLNYTFLFGPSIHIIKNEQYYSIISFLKENKINFINNYFELNEINIGDGIDHVSPDFKKNSTKFYKDLIDG
jgi:hypothetical protein